MDTRDKPNITNDSANHVLRHGSEASRRCRGIPAAGHAELVYLLGSYRTWMGAAAVLHAPDAEKALAVVMQGSDRTSTSLMMTLRAYASVLPGTQMPSPAREADPYDAMNIGLEILSEEDWLASGDTHDEGLEEPIVDATAGLTPAQVYTHLRAFSDGAAGYWLLGRLEASTGLQALLAIAFACCHATSQQLAQLRTAIALQCEAAQKSMQPLVDAVNVTYPFLQATCETLSVEGLSANEPRLIVVDGTHSSNGKSPPG